MQCGKFTVSAVQITAMIFSTRCIFAEHISTSPLDSFAYFWKSSESFIGLPVIYINHFHNCLIFFSICLCVQRQCAAPNKFRCAAHWISLAINCGASIMQYLPFHYSLKSIKVLVKFAQYSVSFSHLRFEMLQSTNRAAMFRAQNIQPEICRCVTCLVNSSSCS